MVELPAGAALVLDLRRPRDRHALARAAEEGRDLLHPLVRRVERPGPPDRKVGVGLRAAPQVVPRHLLFGRQLNAVERNDLVERASLRTLSRTAIIATDVNDQRIVEAAQVLDRLNHATD